jgi:sulfatase maturation enzyme AslB (radical SAM superfamily)
MRTLEWMTKGTPTHTADGSPRGFIGFTGLKQLWAHTGTGCNLHCPSCFEKSGPGDARIASPTLEEMAPLFDQAAGLGVESFGFTGGEPFINKHFLGMLEYALSLAPCLVLSNGAEPLRAALPKLRGLQNKDKLTIRISLDYPDEARHDAGRGKGRFAMALESLKLLRDQGIGVAAARRMDKDEDSAGTAEAFADLFSRNGLPADLPLVAFPNLVSTDETPEITENCISTYHTPESCARFMCASSRMAVKKDGRVSLYACTLVDDDPAYDFGQDLQWAMHRPTLLRHKRCFACFSAGVSCGG